jgi:hypothetical protein
MKLSLQKFKKKDYLYLTVELCKIVAIKVYFVHIVNNN